jgi:hypothetical protein
VPICTASQDYTNISHTTEDLGDGSSGAWGWAHNRTAAAAPFSVSLSTNSTVTYSITSTLGTEAGVIFAKVSASVTGGVSYSHTDTINKTLTISVPAGKYGVVGVDNTYYRFMGTYKIVYGNCTVKTATNTIALFPAANTAQGLEGANISYDPVTPPWPLAP